MEYVIKRSGASVKYNPRKIYAAVNGANKDAGNIMAKGDMNRVVLNVHQKIYAMTASPTVEQIQDMVEDELMNAGFNSVAREYIRYRQIHELQRKAGQKLMESYNDLLFADAQDMDLKRDNANINTDAPMGIMLKLGSEGTKTFVDNYVLDEDTLKADRENWIHIHDKDFSLITLNCCQISLAQLLKGGYNTGHGFLREPNSIRSAASLACIAIQSNQNDMLGGQSICDFDTGLAPYVSKSFKKAFRKYLDLFVKAYHPKWGEDGYASMPGYHMAGGMNDKDSNFCNHVFVTSNMELDFALTDDLLPKYRDWDNGGYQLYHHFDGKLGNDEVERLWRCAVSVAEIHASREVEEETMQAMEAVIHNFNSLHSRAGGQVPFSSINFGMDTSPEGRLIIDCTLQAIWNGLGNGETPIFPISIFQLKAGVNYNPGDPNYDLFRKACRVSAKRLYPNFVNVDASYNIGIYDPKDPLTWASTMGCRTRVATDVNGKDQFGRRGNFAFTTLNLPMIALQAIVSVSGSFDKYDNQKDREAALKKFYKLMDKYTKICKDYLEKRYETIASKKVKNFPFLMGQHVWEGSEELGWEDEIRPVLKHCSLSIGFCGLAECLKALTGFHHGESEDAQKLGLEIIGHLREATDKLTKKTGMNWSTFGTPAESTAGSFARACQKRFGKIPGVCDRGYLTNSSHVPVYYPIKAIDKIRIEAPYHALENAG